MAEQLDRLGALKVVLRYLAAHPDSSARAIGRALDMDDRWIFGLLDAAAYEGICQRSRQGSRDPWTWEICPDGLSLIDDGVNRG